jgi:hypothetical protein
MNIAATAAEFTKQLQENLTSYSTTDGFIGFVNKSRKTTCVLFHTKHTIRAAGSAQRGAYSKATASDFSGGL